MTQSSIVAQGDASDALEEAGASGDTSEAVADFTDAALVAAEADAADDVGDVDGSSAGVNKTPTALALDNADVDENDPGAAIGTLTVTDPGDNHVFFVDDNRFDVVSSQLVLKAGVSLDHETDDGLTVTVTAVDSGGLDVTDSFVITVNDLNEDPVFVTLPSESVAENNTFVQTVVATDPDGDTPTYSITGGADELLFTIDGNTGDLSFIAPPDFESPQDSDSDNIYEVDVTADDGNGGTATQSMSITVGNVVEAVSSFNLSDLNGDNGFKLAGIDAQGYAGYSVGGAGDINGDGFDDVIVGAFRANPGGNYGHGEAYVVFGGETGTPGNLNLSSLDGTNGFAVVVNTIEDLGFAVGGGGDFNGDGIDDALIGAPDGRKTTSGAIAGEGYVVFGSESGFAGTSGSLNVSSLDGSNGYRLFGIDSGDRTGRSISNAGDINGDGVDDIIIGADLSDPFSKSAAGEVYVEFGGSSVGASGSPGLETLDGTNGFVLNGIASGDQAGISVGGGGDFNGDGYDDVIVGARRADPNGELSGETYVLYGKASGFSPSIELSSLNGTNGFEIEGLQERARVGASVSNAGDINADGTDDLIVGGWGDSSSTGESYVIFGHSNLGAGGDFNLASLNGTNGFALRGIDVGDFAGDAVSGAGDVNGDGIDDLIIGADSAGPYGQSYGGTLSLLLGGDNVLSFVGVSQLESDDLVFT